MVTVREITAEVEASLAKDESKMIEAGDAVVIQATDVFGVDFIFGSFHGDTMGLATLPVVRGVHEVAAGARSSAQPILIFGVDANTHLKGESGKKQDVAEFYEECAKLGMKSCFGRTAALTTYNARTYMQAQLNKAVPFSEMKTHSASDINPKDHVLYYDTQAALSGEVIRDNTATRTYVENMAFPTLRFPSDHGVIEVKLRLRLLGEHSAANVAKL